MQVALPPRTRSAVLVVALTATVLGCGSGSLRSDSPYRGVVLPNPWPKAGFTLTATDGRLFDFRQETDGSVTLLFFGYTHCPDVCPVHMANIAAVLRKLAPSVSNQVKVVFVSTDPARDSPERIREWLDHFDPKFIGLRGPLDTINSIQQQIGLAPAIIDETGTDDYAVGHAAQVIAYTRDNLAHVVYPFGTRQTDWAHDLPKLVEEDWGGRS